MAYLACTSRPQPRERLADLLWGAHFEAQARQNLRQALSLLRRILGHEALVSEDNAVSLAPGVIDCDVIRFEALVAEGSRASLAAAADLYRNPLLTDLNIAEEAWLDWRNSERERLAGLAVDSMVGYGQQALRAGNTAAALKNANRAIAVNALREDAHRLAIQALAALGRKAEALKYYQDLAARLRHELSTEPDAATRLLVAELRSAPPPDASPTSNELHRKMHGTSGGKTGTETTAARVDNATAEVVVRSNSFEQRQLTIMVCNLIGPTSYSENLDPEDIHDRIATFQKTAADVAARFGGFVAQYQGYGVLVYFGYPAAHEHDAERAVRAGLAILDSIGKVAAFPEMQLRASVGIATGLVVVGETSTIDDNCHHIATGQTPNLATRLQTRAASGDVVIATSTQRLLGGRFDCRELDPIEVKGQPYPIEAWQVHGERTDVSRYEARHGAGLSPLVGRQEEAELLLRRWNQSRSGEGRVVVISGEAGIGKSRIAENMVAICEAGSHACFRYSCSPHHTDSALFPFIVQIEQQAGFRPGDSDSTRLEKLEALLKPTSANLPRDGALFAELLSLPMDGRHPALKASPQQKQEMTLGALLNRLKDAATRAPLLIVFEDAHWIDPTSLDLLGRMVSSATQLPLLLIVTFRPGFQPDWADQPHVTALPWARTMAPRSFAALRWTKHSPTPLPRISCRALMACHYSSRN
ncbi:AAA family ATPase [Nitrobacter hamburgensis]|uniref:AAA family ATPase n=1 Tax=Nitrobacter hamburgensis TaxID=912 RepID=UPI001FD90F85|nr:AAA family ATPase [Nitrobacter hamburgensis]